MRAVRVRQGSYLSREAVLPFQDLPVKAHAVIILEGHGSTEQDVGDDPQRPHVHSIGVRFAHQDLWCNVLRCATGGLHKALITLLACAGKTKICDHDLGVSARVVVKQILWLQVTMCDAQRMEVFHAIQDHLQHPSGIPFSEGAASTDAVKQLATSGQLHHHVDTLSCLKHLHQLDDISVAHTAQHAKLRFAHLPSFSVPCLNHLNGVWLSCALVLHPHHPAEAATANQGLDLVLGRHTRIKLCSVFGHLSALGVTRLSLTIGCGLSGGGGGASHSSSLAPTLGGGRACFLCANVPHIEVLVDISLMRLYLFDKVKLDICGWFWEDLARPAPHHVGILTP